MTCAEISPLLELTPLLADDMGGSLDLLADAELQALDEHLATCADCRARAEQLNGAYGLWAEAREQTMKPLSKTLRERVLADGSQNSKKADGKKKGVAVAEPAADPAKVEALRAKVVLSCSFCHDGMDREHSVFCASCLAPHHNECFVDHGRCSMPGCEETRTVRPSEPSETRAPRPPKRRGLILALIASLGVGGGIAAATWSLSPPSVTVTKGGTWGDASRGEIWAIGSLQTIEGPKREPVQRVVRQEIAADDLPPPDDLPEDVLFDEDDSDSDLKHDLPSDRIKVTSSKDGRITIDLENEDLATVMNDISAATGRNVIVAPSVHETVAVSLRRIPADQAVDVIAKMTRCEIETLPGGVRLLVQPPKVSIQFKGGNVRTILQLLSSYSGKNVLVGPNVSGHVQMNFMEVNWKRALSTIVKSAKLHVTWIGELPLVTAAALPPASLPPAMTSVLSLPTGTVAKRVNLDVEGVDLTDVCDQLGRQVRRNILVDPNVDERVTVSLRDLPWNDVVTALCRLTGCTVEMRPGGVVLLTQPLKVTFAVRKAPAKALYGLLAGYSAKNISIGQDVRGEITFNASEIHWLQLLGGLAAIHGHKLDWETQDLVALTRGDWVTEWESVKGAATSAKPLHLTAIVKVEGEEQRSAAIVDGEVVRVGDSVLFLNGEQIAGSKVTEIESDRVGFRYKGAEVVRTLGD